MPKNKKPRKKYVKKYGRSNWQLTKHEIEFPKQQLLEMCLLVETKLRAGNCVYEDFILMREFIHWGIIAISTRKGYEDASQDEVVNILDRAAEATMSVQRRGLDNNNQFVCTADELSVIQDVFVFLDQFLRESLDTDPSLVYREWTVMHQNSDRARSQRYSVNTTIGHLRAEIAKCKL